MKKILIIGPFPPPITGESLSNNVIFQELNKDCEYSITKINNSYPLFKENLGNFSFTKAWFYFTQYIRIYKIFKIHIVYLTIGQTFLGILKYAPYILISKWLNKEIIIHIHGNYLSTEYKRIGTYKKKLVKILISKSDKGIVLSEPLKPTLREFIGEQKIFVLSNFVEDYLIEPYKKIVSIKNTNELKILYLSNLMTKKGIFDLFNALEVLKRKEINYKAKFAGEIDSSIRKIVLQFINNDDSLEYLGILSGEKKKNILIWSNVFVFPSYLREGQPISILEAMVTGNIILTTRHPGISEFVTSKNGFYINKQDPNDIAEKLLYVHDNFTDLKNIMIQNYEDVSKLFTVKRFIDSLKSIIQQ